MNGKRALFFLSVAAIVALAIVGPAVYQATRPLEYYGWDDWRADVRGELVTWDGIQAGHSPFKAIGLWGVYYRVNRLDVPANYADIQEALVVAMRYDIRDKTGYVDTLRPYFAEP